MARQTEYLGLKVDKELVNKLLFLAECADSDKSKIAKSGIDYVVARKMKKYPPELFEEWKAKREQENK